MDELSPVAAAVARRAAQGTARTIGRQIFDVDDLQQEAWIIAWLWMREHAYHPSYDSSLVTMLRRHVNLRLIDFMRSAGDAPRRRRDRVNHSERYQPSLSLDAPMTEAGESLRDWLVDPAGPADFDRVEDAHDFRLAFERWDGPDSHAEAAWLHAQGHTTAEIAAAYEVHETRILQRRAAFLRATRRRWTGSDRGPVAA